MKENTKIYWKGIEQLKNDPEFVKNADKEFPEYLPISENENGNSRRDFLKLMGFGVAAVSLAACEAPIRKAIPYLNKPVDVDPSVANYYASTYINGSDYCSVVVKTREGRPIKIEGNKLSKFSGGGTTAQVEASVLSLYDKQRLQNPMKSGAAVTWDDLDAEVKSKLGEIAAAGGPIKIVTPSIVSPSTKKAIANFIAAYPSTQVITYDASSYSGALNANLSSFGIRALPSYNFNKSKTTVSFGADFLGTWLNPVAFSKQFAETRKLGPKKKEMSRLYSFESNLSLTGANADYRSPIRPSEVGLYIGNLYNLIAAKAGAPAISVAKVDDTATLTKAANDLWASKGASIVVSGENDISVQTVVNAINNLLGNYGSTLSWDAPVITKQGDDAMMDVFVTDLSQGLVSGVIFFNCNPVYDHPKGAVIGSSLSKAKFTLSTSDRVDETTSQVTYVAPDNHYLESWNDAEPAKGQYSLSQPAISNIFNTRQAQQSFLTWGNVSTSYFDFIKENWKETHFASQTEIGDFQTFWDQCLYNGVFEGDATSTMSAVEFSGDANAAATKIAGKYKKGTGLELVTYESIAIGAGEQANNPWLQEMPDPLSKVCWENYISMSQSTANELGIEMKEGFTTKVNVKAGIATVTLPVVVQPGQAAGTVGVALGYGRTKAGKVADGVGVNAFALLSSNSEGIVYSVAGVTIEPTGESYRIAQTQTHQTFMGRETVIQEATLAEYKADASAGRYKPMISSYSGPKKPNAVSLWKGHEYNNHHWGMVIDLNSCTGCAACSVACQVENNIPVVGKEEVVNRREMAWLRIDRYYSSQGNKEDKSMEGLSMLEKASENPEVTFQPMMCQQCNNAPCETVCPVAATTHSTEGLNQMTYNRCIGTRYCANNCPFKVRRFNWFKYHDNRQFPDNTSMNNELGKMVLNPDVVVRARGVMEKCSFCVQRIQTGKLNAKKQGRRPVDGEISTACATACPTEAIVFGDMKDSNSRISQLLRLSATEEGDTEVKEERAYNVLEEIGVKPNVWYFTKIRNKELTDNQA
ncbi:MAG: TAT-variant-translocated molybdopterin oxidoreductase [Imperialibacter sp.]